MRCVPNAMCVDFVVLVFSLTEHAHYVVPVLGTYHPATHPIAQSPPGHHLQIVLASTHLGVREYHLEECVIEVVFF